MNEFASDEDNSEGSDELQGLSKEDIVKNNISKRTSQIIVPLTPISDQDCQEDSFGEQSQYLELGDQSFEDRISSLQSKAREDLVNARETSRVKIQHIINRRKKLLNKNLFNLLGLPQETKVNFKRDMKKVTFITFLCLMSSVFLVFLF